MHVIMNISPNCMSTLNVIYNASACILQTDMHGQLHVHAGMPCKFTHACMHACLARNYPEALSHCVHGYGLTSVAHLSVINIADINSAFDKTLTSERFC